MIQGDICYFTFKEPDKRRPVLVLTRIEAIRHLSSVTVAQITTATRDLKSMVWLDETDGLAQVCVVNLDNIQIVQKDKLGKVVAHLSLERMREVREAIEFAFDFKNL